MHLILCSPLGTTETGNNITITNEQQLLIYFCRIITTKLAIKRFKLELKTGNGRVMLMNGNGCSTTAAALNCAMIPLLRH